ncbi:diaminopimelate decarboxylase [Brevibacillus composti]|uniref:Diaminopimelate decarboxylase n=1 Tax=Brevibacillus composti TaxID=2796470 RepID=A0A7T5EHT5_9BACL|nr:diaminopimelate decarboxylase [Brevibacillus composti]QQE72830.1 diaminopimelate decarboxylase [Brevibacillus composti]QUO39908.1 diaminopimelate decarboxylase [Brevibacillus composti]
MYLHGTSRVNEQGHLEIGGCDVTKLAAEFGTPLYVYDEALIRSKCRAFVDAFRASGFSFQVAYASKAFCTMAMCKLVEEEGLSLDVVSGGELYTALQAGFPVERIHFHGNNKSLEEILMALDAKIGCFVVDNFYELSLLAELGRERQEKIAVLLRVTPGVEAHTHEYISTGQQDSKFGFDVISGQALQAIRQAETSEWLELLGVHSHIGSQIFEAEGFLIAIGRLAELLDEARKEVGFVSKVLNVGGGFGIRYVEGDTPMPPEHYVQAITKAVREEFQTRELPLPELWIEPGRSIVGDAGTTLYHIGSQKEIPQIRKYIAVNGGMTDNLRPALYQARYEAAIANRMNDKDTETVSVAGKCCESGDMLIHDIALPEAKPGDILAVSSTGAYGYAMSNNYNRIPRPAVVFVHEGTAELVVKRESFADMVSHDLLPKGSKVMR